MLYLKFDTFEGSATLKCHVTSVETLYVLMCMNTESNLQDVSFSSAYLSSPSCSARLSHSVLSSKLGIEIFPKNEIGDKRIIRVSSIVHLRKEGKFKIFQFLLKLKKNNYVSMFSLCLLF